MAARRTSRSPVRLSSPAPSPSKTTMDTPTTESASPRTPLLVGRPSPSTAPRSRPHTGAVAKMRPVLAGLGRRTPAGNPVRVVGGVLGCGEVETPEHGGQDQGDLGEYCCCIPGLGHGRDCTPEL